MSSHRLPGFSSFVLSRRLNWRSIELAQGTHGEDVGVLRRDGEVTYFPWLGFIASTDAMLMKGRPVKLVVTRIGTVTPHGNSWVDLAPGQYVQGCLTTKGVYAVVEGRVRLV